MLPVAQCSAVTPEDAAFGEIPPEEVRVLATEISPDDRFAMVFAVLGTGPSAEPYYVVCERYSGGWVGGSGGNGPGRGWTSTWNDHGVAYAWDEVPRDVVEVEIALAGAVHPVPVREGWFVLVSWDVPFSHYEEHWPEVSRVSYADGRVERVEAGWPGGLTRDDYRRLRERMRQLRNEVR
jgi:hypothetical protein